jgi:signal peptidase I
MEHFHSKPFPEPSPVKTTWWRRLLWDLVTTIIPALFIALFVNVFIAEAAEVIDGPSMQPNLYVGCRMMTEKVSYRFHRPQRGDIVVAQQPDG